MNTVGRHTTIKCLYLQNTIVLPLSDQFFTGNEDGNQDGNEDGIGIAVNKLIGEGVNEGVKKEIIELEAILLIREGLKVPGIGVQSPIKVVMRWLDVLYNNLLRKPIMEVARHAFAFNLQKILERLFSEIHSFIKFYVDNQSFKYF